MQIPHLIRRLAQSYCPIQSSTEKVQLILVLAKTALDMPGDILNLFDLDATLPLTNRIFPSTACYPFSRTVPSTHPRPTLPEEGPTPPLSPYPSSNSRHNPRSANGPMDLGPDLRWHTGVVPHPADWASTVCPPQMAFVRVEARKVENVGAGQQCLYLLLPRWVSVDPSIVPFAIELTTNISCIIVMEKGVVADGTLWHTSV
mmetsp:Transcript_11154/g.33038  ORF Transcript_11154/g.33038 Transcript_11154/m.33038 type:complete len:202 (+) Transcript_11154:502-1107(+)